MQPNRKLATQWREQTVLRGTVLLLLLLSLFSSAAVRAMPIAHPHRLTAATPGLGDAEWSPAHIAVTPTGEYFLGPYERNDVTFIIADLPAHGEVTLAFDFYAIATWDGNAGEEIGPDVFNVTHSGDQTLLNTTFSNYPGEHDQAYPGSYPGASHPGQTGASAVGTLGYGLDAVYALDFTFAHTASRLQVKFSTSGLQGDGDESWGLDNVVVKVDDQVVYAFDATTDPTDTVVEVARLLADDGQAYGHLGAAVAVHEELLAVGAPVTLLGEDVLDLNQNPGAVYLFARNPAGVYQWDPIQKLTPADGAPQDHFGWAVALDTDLLVVSAPWAEIGGNLNQGAIYFFAPSAADPNQWEQIQKLTVADGAAEDQLGRSLALRGSLLLAGAQGKAYLFGRDNDGHWTQMKKLVASDGQAGDYFGISVALAGDVALVGASGAEIGANDSQGAAYLFLHNHGGTDNWGEFKKLTAADGGAYTAFGTSVILAENQAIISGPGKRQVYVFSRNWSGALDTWAEVQRLTSIDGQASYNFGSSLAYHDQRLVVSSGWNQAEVFEHVSGDLPWAPLRKIAGSTGAGIGVGRLALGGHLLFVGSPDTSSAVGGQGAVYLFDLTGPAAPLYRFSQTAYGVQESGGTAEITIDLDRPSPYPLTIDYTTVTIQHEAIPIDDYTPVSGTLSILTGATQGVIRVPLTNDDRLEMSERFEINLGKSPGGLLANAYSYAFVTIQDDDSVAACDYVAYDEVSLDRAIRCLYLAEPGIYTIHLTNDIALTRPLPLLTSANPVEVIMEGNGHTIDAQGHGRLLTIYRGKVEMRHLTLRGGRLPQVQNWESPNDGGALYVTAPREGFGSDPSCGLTLTNVILTDNEAYAGGALYYGCEEPLTVNNTTMSNNRAVYGGAFSTSGGEEFFTEAFIQGSTFSGNTATVAGGAFDLAVGDGGIVLHLVNSTVSGNQAMERGGGLFLDQASHDGRSEAQLINSTVANNEAPEGSGVYNEYGRLLLSNSLVADNHNGSNCILFTSEDGNGQLLSQGHNLDSDGTCLPAGVRQSSDIINGNDNLAPLADNGGATQTHALLTGSQALEAADNAVCAAQPVNNGDQRGMARPQGATCDIGAYEHATEEPGPIRISALIDGRSQLLLRGHRAQWHHFDFAAPGRLWFADEPTVINGQAWFPVWPDTPDAENRDCNCFSDVFTGVLPPLPPVANEYALRAMQSRGSASIIQQPTASNDFTLIIELDDNPEDGGALYVIDIVPSTTSNRLFASSSSSGTAGAVKFRDEDIVAYDFGANTWHMVFDGSDVGVTKDVDAFAFRPDGSVLLSFNAPMNVPGLGQVDDSDIVQFTPTASGNNTAGNFAWFLQGATVGLTTDGEDIDAIGFTAADQLVVSTIGDFATPSASGKDEDLIELDGGTWRLFMDGSTVGLANEDVNGLWIDPLTSQLYLTVKDSFAFADVEIDSDDIFVCTPTGSGANTTCAYARFWDSDIHDYGSENLDGIGFGALPASLVASGQGQSSAASTPDEAVTDDDLDDINLEELTNRLFLPFVQQ